MIKDNIKSPIISRNKSDPTQSYKSLNKTYRNLQNRYYSIKIRIKEILDNYLIGRETVSNETFIFREGVIYQANASYIYDMTPEQLNELLRRIQAVLDEYLLGGGETDLWMLSTISDEYRRGTHSAFTNLSHQSSYYAEQTTFTALLSRPVYQNQLAQVFTLTFSDWKGLAETAKADLTNVIVNAISRGVNPRETARIISRRLDVSMSKAKALAQTEQLSAFRQAQWNETEWSKDRLGLKTALIHISALLTSSRITHVYWHGRIRTVEEVQDWYSQNGNRFNCHCSQIPILLDENGEVVNKGLIEKLIEEREAFVKLKEVSKEK